MGVDRAYGSGEVSALKHDAARRRNIPTAEFESVMRALLLPRARISVTNAASFCIMLATTSEVFMAREQDFATKLRWWRQRRGWPQLKLAGHAGISQRHLSFLELGRASPSREMVIRLATALDISLRQHNALLLAAGFAPVWRETPLAAPELSQVRKAVDYILAQQEPFPAVGVDRHWNLIKANSGMNRLVEFLIGPQPPDAKVNLADALVAPDVLRPFLTNWEEVVRHFIRSVEADALADGDPRTAELLERLRKYKGVHAALKTVTTGAGPSPVLPMRLRKGDVSLQLFTTIATLGTPQDVTAQELRVECFFPMDDGTANKMRAWGSKRR